MFKYRDLVGQTFNYSDKATGTGWEIEVFHSFRNETDYGTILVLTDNVQVKMERFDTLRGTTHIINKIIESYGKAMNKLECTNVN